jgi:hypothetical protein
MGSSQVFGKDFSTQRPVGGRPEEREPKWRIVGGLFPLEGFTVMNLILPSRVVVRVCDK